LGLNIPQAMFVLVIQNGGTDAAAGAETTLLFQISNTEKEEFD